MITIIMKTGSRLDPDRTVADLIAEHPWLLQALIDQGYTPLRVPAVREVMARTTTLRAAAARKDRDISGLIDALEASRPKDTP